MNMIKKHSSTISIVFIVLLLFLALFYSIYARIDGFGVFSIVIGIMFFTFIAYKTRSTQNNGNGSGSNGDGATITNVSHLFKVITNPVFIRLLPSLLTVIFSSLLRHKEKLNNHAIQELQENMQDFLNKLNLNDWQVNNNSNHDEDSNIKSKNKPKDVK